MILSMTTAGKTPLMDKLLELAQKARRLLPTNPGEMWPYMQHSKCLIPHTFRVFFFLGGGGKFSMLFAEAALVIYFVVDHVGWLKQARLCFLPDF